VGLKRVVLLSVLLLAASAIPAQGAPDANRDVARFLKQVRGNRTLVVAFHPF
jgi:hypothetical protein